MLNNTEKFTYILIREISGAADKSLNKLFTALAKQMGITKRVTLTECTLKCPNF